MSEPIITFIATIYEETTDIYQFLSCLRLQSDPAWQCLLTIDGDSQAVINELQLIKSNPLLWDSRCDFIVCPHKGFWGHYSRQIALEHATTEFVLQTSIQDYYTPNTVSEIRSQSSHDFIYFDCIHNHFAHNILNTVPKRSNIDWGSFVVRTWIAKHIGIQYPESGFADGLFVEQCIDAGVTAVKIKKVLQIHN